MGHARLNLDRIAGEHILSTEMVSSSHYHAHLMYGHLMGVHGEGATLSHKHPLYGYVLIHIDGMAVALCPVYAVVYTAIFNGGKVG